MSCGSGRLHDSQVRLGVVARDGEPVGAEIGHDGAQAVCVRSERQCRARCRAHGSPSSFSFSSSMFPALSVTYWFSRLEKTEKAVSQR